MELYTLDEFIADIETTFSNYAATNDIDRNSVKSWIIECLRRFGKNICDKRETIVEIKNSRAVLPETFKSIILALKIEDEDLAQKRDNKRLIVEKQKIENPAYWSNATQDYFVDNCTSKITTEKIYTYYEHEDRCYNYQWLSLVPGFSKSTVDAECLNLHPSIRNSYLNQISITQRTINTNFKEGKIYLQYNSLPVSGDESNSEIAIPIISTGDIHRYIELFVKCKITENLIINDKNPQSLLQLFSLWNQQLGQSFILAKSEANWSGISTDFGKRVYAQNRRNQDLYNLPK